MVPLRLWLGAALPLLLGCQATLMPTPLVYTRGKLDPFAGFPAGETPNVVEVFYATDRNPVDDPDPEDRYGNRRGYLLRLGEATVRMGDADVEWSEYRAATLDGARQPERLAEVREYGPLWTTVPRAEVELAPAAPDGQAEPRGPALEFAAAIDRRLAFAPNREITVFVPGINTGFGRPLLLAAGLAHFLGTDGVVVAYCWPVAGNMLAYSRGAAVVSGALLQLRLLHSGSDVETMRAQARIGTVVYAGPDEDVDLFRALFLDRVDDLVDSFLVYLSTQDLALHISGSFMSGTDRLGRPSEVSEHEAERIRGESVSAFIDVGRAQDRAGRGLWGHSFWIDNSWVSSDLILALRYGLAPDQRGLVREDGELTWSFPEDYPGRLGRIARDLRPTP